MAPLKAQSHGCPAISYDINYGPAEIIDDHVSGELIPANDQDTVSELIPLIGKARVSKEIYQQSSTICAKVFIQLRSRKVGKLN